MNNQNRGCGFIAIPIGLLVFFAAFFVIWFNEGRVDLSVIAEDSVPLLSEEYYPENEGELVSVSGTIESVELLGDAPYFKPQDFIHLKRTAEMYAWDETGSEEDGYDYRKVWTSSPEDSSSFEWPSGHENPPMAVESDNFSAQEASLGRYTILPTQIVFNQVDEVSLTEGNVSGGRMHGNFVYVGSASPQEPNIGDIRLSYSGFRGGQFGTVFGKQQESQIVTWRGDDDTLLYRAYSLDREGGIAALRTEYLTALWGTRIAALFMFFFGLLMALTPLRTILGYVPILGRAGNMVIALVAFLVALTIWLVTLTIAILLHNIIALMVVLALIGGAGYYFWSMREKVKSPDDLGMA